MGAELKNEERKPAGGQPGKPLVIPEFDAPDLAETLRRTMSAGQFGGRNAGALGGGVAGMVAEQKKANQKLDRLIGVVRTAEGPAFA
jgi:hypothetical protein